MIFVDTGAWFAATIPADEDYRAADRWIKQNREPLVTSDAVVSETLTLLNARGQYHKAIEVGEKLFAGRIARIEHVTSHDVNEAWKTFSAFSDKDWSFTDCTSRVVMQRLGIRTAFAFDDDFRQFGTVDVVPSLAV